MTHPLTNAFQFLGYVFPTAVSNSRALAAHSSQEFLHRVIPGHVGLLSPVFPSSHYMSIFI